MLLKHISSSHIFDNSQLSMTPPSYLKTPSPTSPLAPNVTTPIMQKSSALLLSRTFPQLWNYPTMMQEHQSTQRVMSPGLQAVWDSSRYKGKQGHVTPTKSWRSVSIAKDPLIHLLSAPSLSKGHGPRLHKGRHLLSLYQSLRRTRPHPSTPITPSNPYPRGLGNLLHR